MDFIENLAKADVEYLRGLNNHLEGLRDEFLKKLSASYQEKMKQADQLFQEELHGRIVAIEAVDQQNPEASALARELSSELAIELAVSDMEQKDEESRKLLAALNQEKAECESLLANYDQEFLEAVRQSDIKFRGLLDARIKCPNLPISHALRDSFICERDEVRVLKLQRHILNAKRLRGRLEVFEDAENQTTDAREAHP